MTNLFASKLKPSKLAQFSTREAQLLRLAESGHSNTSAAKVLGISEATVSTYWNRIRSKVGLRTRMEILLYLRDETSTVEHTEPNSLGARMGIAQLDEHGAFVRVNEHWLSFFGGRISSWVGMSVREFDQKLDGVLGFASADELIQLLGTRKQIVRTGSIRTPDGSAIEVRLTMNFARLQHRRSRQILISAEQTTLPSVALVESSAIGFEDGYFSHDSESLLFIIDSHGRIVACPIESARTLGLSVDLAVGKCLWEIVDSEGIYAAGFGPALPSTDWVRHELVYREPSGQAVPIHWSVAPLCDRQGAGAYSVALGIPRRHTQASEPDVVERLSFNR